MKKNIACPHCGQKNTWKADNEFKPFCSERCKLIDLGGWASERYRVVGEDTNVSDEEEDQKE
jgi:uncharacterized protein